MPWIYDRFVRSREISTWLLETRSREPSISFASCLMHVTSLNWILIFTEFVAPKKILLCTRMGNECKRASIYCSRAHILLSVFSIHLLETFQNPLYLYGTMQRKHIIFWTNDIRIMINIMPIFYESKQFRTFESQ